MKKLILAVLLPAMLAGCSDDKKPQKPSTDGFWGLFSSSTLSQNAITITDIEGQSLAGAKVLIGDAVGTPFADNFLIADSNGQVELPAEWSTPQNLTVEAAGYLRATYMNQSPEAITIKLRRLSTQTQYEVTGKALELPVKDKDGFIDFGLVMPAFTKMDLLSFDLNDVISPQADRIEVMGQNLDVPANISLPKQSEKYSFFTITLDKPAYRVYYGEEGVNRVFAARGRFPFKKVVDEMRGGAEFYDLINEFEINGGGIRDIHIKSGQTRLDLPTRELNFTQKQDVMAPTVRGDELFIAVGIANQSGYMIPTDVKKISSGRKMAIQTLAGADQMVLGVVKKTSEMKNGNDRMSATLLPLTNGVSPSMLPLIADPAITNDGEILLPKINPIDGVHPVATYTVLSHEEEVVQGRTKVKLMSPQWEVYSQEWQERVKLPEWPETSSYSGKKRWEVNLIGSQTASQVGPGPAMLEAATHVTHSSISF